MEEIFDNPEMERYIDNLNMIIHDLKQIDEDQIIKDQNGFYYICLQIPEIDC